MSLKYEQITKPKQFLDFFLSQKIHLLAHLGFFTDQDKRFSRPFMYMLPVNLGIGTLAFGGVFAYGPLWGVPPPLGNLPVGLIPDFPLL